MADLLLVDEHRDEVSAIADAAVAEALTALQSQDFEALSPRAFTAGPHLVRVEASPAHLVRHPHIQR